MINKYIWLIWFDLIWFCNHLKTSDELRCFGRVRNSCYTYGSIVFFERFITPKNIRGIDIWPSVTDVGFKSFDGALGATDHGLEPRSGQTEDYEIVICEFTTTYAL